MSLFMLERKIKNKKIMKYNDRMFYPSDEVVKNQSEMYLESFLRNTGNQYSYKIDTYYQLNTKNKMSLIETLQYDIECPKCTIYIKPYNLGSDGYTHSLYVCPNCYKKEVK